MFFFYKVGFRIVKRVFKIFVSFFVDVVVDRFFVCGDFRVVGVGDGWRGRGGSLVVRGVVSGK